MVCKASIGPKIEDLSTYVTAMMVGIVSPNSITVRVQFFSRYNFISLQQFVYRHFKCFCTRSEYVASFMLSKNRSEAALANLFS